jgi:hypothetical protein
MGTSFSKCKVWKVFFSNGRRYTCEKGMLFQLTIKYLVDEVCSIRKWKPNGMPYIRYNSQMKWYSFEMQGQI